MAEISEEQVKLQFEENIPVLLEKISKYEATVKSNSDKINQLEGELKKKDDLITILKKQLEDQITEGEKLKTQNAKESEEIAVLKSKTENTLTRAKEMIFEKTKIVKNQELQIDALNQQIVSLKEVVSITKDLLEIRNLEVKQLEIKMQCMEDKIAAEKERQDLIHQKLEHMIRHNGELKREYETQLCLFSALRERYTERELARDVLNNATPRLNGEINNTPAETSNDLNNIIPEVLSNEATLEVPSVSNNDAITKNLDAENKVPTEVSDNIAPVGVPSASISETKESLNSDAATTENLNVEKNNVANNDVPPEISNDAPPERPIGEITSNNEQDSQKQSE